MKNSLTELDKKRIEQEMEEIKELESNPLLRYSTTQLKKRIAQTEESR